MPQNTQTRYNDGVQPHQYDTKSRAILWRSLLALFLNLLNLYPASYEDSLKFFRRADQTTIQPNINYRSQKIKQTYAVRPRPS